MRRNTKVNNTKSGGRTLKSLEKELWKLCRELTFSKYGNTCYTCGSTNLEGANRQCGHFYPKGALGASMKYDIRVLRPQCYRCNINHGGMGAAYLKQMERELGFEAAHALYQECRASKGKPVKAWEHYISLIEVYSRAIAHGGATI